MRVRRTRPVARRGRMMVWNASSSTVNTQTIPAVIATTCMRSPSQLAIYPGLQSVTPGPNPAGRLSATSDCLILAVDAADMVELGKALLGIGILLAIVGGVLLIAGRT